MIAIVHDRIVKIIREGGTGSGFYGHAGRPGVRGGSIGSGSKPDVHRGVIAIAMKAVRHEGGGFSVSLRGDVPSTGLVVGGAGTRYVTDPPISAQAVDKYIHTNLGELSKASHYLGGWVSDGKIHLDVSTIRVGQTVRDALDEARTRDEIAIYSLDEGKEYYTMSDSKRPSESKGDPLHESARSAKGTLFIFGKDVSSQEIADALNVEANRQRKAMSDARRTITIRPDAERG
jgi:hypothetical protein